jgi:hypothetical protein
MSRPAVRLPVYARVSSDGAGVDGTVDEVDETGIVVRLTTGVGFFTGYFVGLTTFLVGVIFGGDEVVEGVEVVDDEVGAVTVGDDEDVSVDGGDVVVVVVLCVGTVVVVVDDGGPPIGTYAGT